MHLVKFSAAPAQLLVGVYWFWLAVFVCCGAASAAGALEPPLKRPPMAWPIVEPTATPLGRGLVLLCV